MFRWCECLLLFCGNLDNNLYYNGSHLFIKVEDRQIPALSSPTPIPAGSFQAPRLLGTDSLEIYERTGEIKDTAPSVWVNEDYHKAVDCEFHVAESLPTLDHEDPKLLSLESYTETKQSSAHQYKHSSLPAERVSHNISPTCGDSYTGGSLCTYPPSPARKHSKLFSNIQRYRDEQTSVASPQLEVCLESQCSLIEGESYAENICDRVADEDTHQVNAGRNSVKLMKISMSNPIHVM